MKKYIWPLLIAIIVGGIVYFLPTTVDINNRKYILSSIAQGFASLFALLFVIMFFLCQSTDRVSMLEQILKPDGYLLLSVFVVTILFPLVVLKIGIYDILISISITVAALCLFALYPFLKSVNNSLKQLGVISNISKIPSLNVDYRKKLETQKILDDLLVFSAKEIVEVSPDEIISIFADMLSSGIREEFYTIHVRREYVTMLSELSVFSFILRDNKKIIIKVIERHFGYMLEHNWRENLIEAIDLFKLSIEGILEILIKLNENSKIDLEINLLIAKSLVEPAFHIKEQIYDKSNTVYEKKSQLIESKIKEIYKAGYLKWNELNEGINRVSARDKAADKKERFREELKERLGVI